MVSKEYLEGLKISQGDPIEIIYEDIKRHGNELVYFEGIGKYEHEGKKDMLFIRTSPESVVFPRNLERIARVIVLEPKKSSE